MFDLIGGAVAAFVATNLDGFVLLTLLFASPGAQGRTVVVGQYLGLALLVAISAIAAVGLVVVPTRWVGLLGVIPLALGIRALTGRTDHTPQAPRVNLLGVVGLVVADGADNVAVYTPAFRHLGPARSLGYTLVFVALAAVWCVLAAALARRRAIAQTVERLGHILVPVVFIVIGLALLGTTLALLAPNVAPRSWATVSPHLAQPSPTGVIACAQCGAVHADNGDVCACPFRALRR
jgi:cadmium resistance protein CadD (predicted permease)